MTLDLDQLEAAMRDDLAYEAANPGTKLVLNVRAAEVLALVERVRRLEAVTDAARDLYERVEMDESVGICLTDRVPSLRLGDALAVVDAPEPEPKPRAKPVGDWEQIQRG